MFLERLPEELLARINPAEARDYARASGWVRVQHSSAKVALFQDPNADLEQLLIPTDPDLADYARRMGEVVQGLADRERRPAREVLNELLLPPADMLRFRVEGPDTTTGEIGLQQGIHLLNGAKQALLAAACSVLQPQKFHPRLSRADADQFLESCRLAPPERGSFTTVVACPLQAVKGLARAGDTLPLFAGRALDEDDSVVEEHGPPGRPEPFTRQVTSLLMRSVDRIARAIDDDDLDSIARDAPSGPIISANLCDALVSMGPRGERSQLTLMANWARSLPPPGKNGPPNKVRLRGESLPRVEWLATRLRPTRQSKVAHFVGLVDILSGSPDEHGRVRGEVQLLLYVQDETVKARLSLDADDYHRAWEAHGAARYVSLYGRLEKTGDRTWHIRGPTRFRVLGDD